MLKFSKGMFHPTLHYIQLKSLSQDYYSTVICLMRSASFWVFSFAVHNRHFVFSYEVAIDCLTIGLLSTAPFPFLKAKIFLGVTPMTCLKQCAEITEACTDPIIHASLPLLVALQWFASMPVPGIKVQKVKFL